MIKKAKAKIISIINAILTIILIAYKILLRSFKIILLALIIVVAATLGERAHKHYIYDFKGSSVVMLTGSFMNRASGGTGFQVQTRNGNQYTMTNYHVCMLADDNKSITAILNSGARQTIKVKHYSKLHDLCLLEPVKTLRPIYVANSANLHEEVHIVGHPRLEARTFESGSIVSYKVIKILMPTLKSHPCKNGIDLSLLYPMPDPKYKACGETLLAMHTNAISYGGNSGSPVLDDLGNLIGVLFAGTRGIPTSSLVVPLESIKTFLHNK